MFEQMKTDLNMSEIPINSSFRTMADQQAAWDQYGSPQAAKPGYSNHQTGVAIDFGGGPCAYKVGTRTCPESKIWSWLKDNASKYGIKQLSSEWWHWSPLEG
jgi:LAS superfamily LD-carboxypeptidase LdcB